MLLYPLTGLDRSYLLFSIHQFSSEDLLWCYAVECFKVEFPPISWQHLRILQEVYFILSHPIVSFWGFLFLLAYLPAVWKIISYIQQGDHLFLSAPYIDHGSSFHFYHHYFSSWSQGIISSPPVNFSCFLLDFFEPILIFQDIHRFDLRSGLKLVILLSFVPVTLNPYLCNNRSTCSHSYLLSAFEEFASTIHHLPQSFSQLLRYSVTLPDLLSVPGFIFQGKPNFFIVPGCDHATGSTPTPTFQQYSQVD